jgi:hypothetical protein
LAPCLRRRSQLRISSHDMISALVILVPMQKTTLGLPRQGGGGT